MKCLKCHGEIKDKESVLAVYTVRDTKFGTYLDPPDIKDQEGVVHVSCPENKYMSMDAELAFYKFRVQAELERAENEAKLHEATKRGLTAATKNYNRAQKELDIYRFHGEKSGHCPACNGLAHRDMAGVYWHTNSPRSVLKSLARHFEAMGEGADNADQWAWEWKAQEAVEEFMEKNFPEEES